MFRLPDYLREPAFWAYKYSGAMWLHESLLRPQFMTILLFHRITDIIPEDGLTVHPKRFRRICQLLRDRFHVVPLGDIFAILRSGKPMPPRTVAITFDDCYSDNLGAARVLNEFGLPATFFVPTDFVGSGHVFDWDRGLPKLPNLTWEEVREMVALGHEIGSHTVSHANLGTASPDVARAEIIDSRKILQDRLGSPIRWFAYPYGGPHHLRPEYVPFIEEAGYDGAMSAYGGFVRPGISDKVLPREAVPYFKTPAHLEMHLSGCLHWWYALRGRDRVLARSPWPYGGHALQAESTAGTQTQNG